jgi:hypothetical protein
MHPLRVETMCKHRLASPFFHRVDSRLVSFTTVDRRVLSSSLGFGMQVCSLHIFLTKLGLPKTIKDHSIMNFYLSFLLIAISIKCPRNATVFDVGVVKMRKPGKRSRERHACFCSNHKDEKDKYFFKVLVGDFRERLVGLQVHYVLGKCSFFKKNFCCHRHLCLLRGGDIVLAVICATKTLKSPKEPEWKDLASCRCRLKPKIYVPYYCSELLKLDMLEYCSVVTFFFETSSVVTCNQC